MAIKVILDGSPVNEINSIASFNDNTKLELKEDGFLGEPTARYDETIQGFGGDFEFQTNDANWQNLEESIIARAKREQPALVFNIVRTDFYANGQTAIVTYKDVHWGPIPKTIAGKNDFVKVKMEFGCSDRTVQINSLL